MDSFPRVRADIDLDAAVHNAREMHRLTSPGTRLMAVVKTDGYGHGAVPIARELESEEYVYGYAVAAPEEASAMRSAGIKKPILILGSTFPEQYRQVLEEDVMPAVFTPESAGLLSKAAGELGRVAGIHIKIDTGMSRIGFLADDSHAEESADAIAGIARMPNIRIEGMFTHLARADEADKRPTYRQLERFERMSRLVRERGVDIPMLHCSNSAGILDLPEANLDMVRAGITLYGLHPSEDVHMERVDSRPVLSLKSRLAHVKWLPAGSGISYGATYVTDGPRLIATIPVGYGDGYARALSNKGEVIIRGRRAPIRGRICMDQFMADVTGIPGVRVGDQATLVGRDGDECITLEELGERSGRFNYEFACDLGKRVPRVYWKGGERIAEWTWQGGLTYYGHTA